MNAPEPETEIDLFSAATAIVALGIATGAFIAFVVGIPVYVVLRILEAFA